MNNKTKGQKLLFLNDKVSIFKIPKTICLKCSEVYSATEHFIDTKLLVIRSSASDEDASTVSSAGEYESVLNVGSHDRLKF